jgi:hypothetical protein
MERREVKEAVRIECVERLQRAVVKGCVLVSLGWETGTLMDTCSRKANRR